LICQEARRLIGDVLHYEYRLESRKLVMESFNELFTLEMVPIRYKPLHDPEISKPKP
jgi:hypothetical protein